MRLRRSTVALAVVALVLVTFPAAALAGKGYGKGGRNTATEAIAPSCTVDGRSVTGHDLPLTTLLNFMIQDESGTTGGCWARPVPEPGP